MTGNARAELPQDTITAAFARAVAEVPDKIFLDFSGERFTYADVDRLSTELAGGLLELEVKPGEPVASILDNNIDAITVWLAINKIGAVSAPVNTAFKGDFLRNQLADCGARVIVGEADYVPRIGAIADGLPSMQHIVTRRAEALAAGQASRTALDDLRKPGATLPPDQATPDQLAMIVYTSGTTGASKGCMLPHNLATNLGWSAVVNHGFNADDIIWSPLPLFHLNAIATSVVTAMMARATVALAPRFSVSQFWPEIERTRANSVGLLGSMATLIAEAPDNEHSRRCYGQLTRVSAAPFPPELVQKWRDRFGAGAKGSAGYGMTEAATITGLAPDEPPGPPGSSGHGERDFQVKIFDDNDVEVPRGTVGEIVARPLRPNIMFQGYWQKPEATVAAWRNLWFHTGDLGRMDENGFVYFVDRKKDYIRRRGENISTFEMEAVFRQHPALRDLAVHAVLSPLGEDEVKITAELHDRAALTEEELCRWSIERLPRFAVPQYIEFRDDLPRSATGKVLKEQLRAEGRTAATWDREKAGVILARH
jgi:crotonobetaine/carnitine-CoA ligase